MIRFTENSDISERWIMTGPEISRVVEECTCANDNDDDELPHHEEGCASQDRFQRHAKDLLEVLLSKGNHFKEDSEYLPYLYIGQEQYKNFSIDLNDTLVTAPIKRNSLMLFHQKNTQKQTAIKQKIQHFKHHAELYGQTFVALDNRGGDLKEFCRHESSPYPPALSSEGSLNSCTKSDLLVYSMAAGTSSAISVDEDVFAPDFNDLIIIDGGVLIHSLPGTTVQGKAFNSYFDKVFYPRVHHDLKRSTGIYIALTIKGGVREKRGRCTRQRVTVTTKMKGNWQRFLANVDDKKELFSFLSQKITDVQCLDDKDVYITAGDHVQHVVNGPPMEQCHYEEADARVIVHLLHAL